MINHTYTFQEFKDIYFTDFGGYMPIYAFYEDGKINIEMIVNWRLLDGKVRVAEIATNNLDEIKEIQKYLTDCGDWWKSEMSSLSTKILEAFNDENQ